MFIRLRYDTGFGGFRMRMGPPWSHDYPRGEMHFMKIIEEITQIKPRTDGSNILSLDDPELFNYPVAYMCEPGFWTPSDKQAENFRAYIRKGGFVIFDDFRGYDWDNLQAQMRRVLPEWHWMELDGTHPIFHSFFEIDDPLSLAPPYGGLPPSVLGHLRGQRPEQASRRHREREQRHQRILGMVRHRLRAGRSLERSVQVRRQLSGVWNDALDDG